MARKLSRAELEARIAELEAQSEAFYTLARLAIERRDKWKTATHEGETYRAMCVRDKWGVETVYTIHAYERQRPTLSFLSHDEYRKRRFAYAGGSSGERNPMYEACDAAAMAFIDKWED